MSEWKNIPFKKILVDESISYGIVQPGKHQEYDSTPIVRVNNFRDRRLDVKDALKVSNDIEKKYVRTRLKGGELLITVVGSIGICAIAPASLKGWNVARAVAVANIKDEFDKKFIMYQFESEEIKFQLYGNTNDTVQPTLNLSDLKEIKFNIPTLAEQYAISSVISSLDDRIDLLLRQNATLEAMAEALFRQWFMVEAKDEWEEGTLADAINFYDSQRIPLSQTERDKKKTGKLYPYYGAAQIMDYINEYIFDGDFLLIAEDGTVRTGLGFPVLQRTEGKFWVNNHTHIVSAKIPYTNDFIYISLLKRNIDEIVTGAVQPKISQGNLKKLPFLRFPENLVVKYNNVTNPYFQKIKANKYQIRTLEKLRDTLLPKLMSGEVRVRLDAEAPGPQRLPFP